MSDTTEKTPPTMNVKEAVQTLVEFVDLAPPWDKDATAVRIVLARLKEQELALDRLVTLGDRLEEACSTKP